MKLDSEFRAPSGTFLTGSPSPDISLPGLALGFLAISADQRLGFAESFQQVIDGLPEQIALIDDQWTILCVNPAWTKTAVLYGYEALTPGTNYVDFCEARAVEGHMPARIAAAGIRELARNGQPTFRFVYHGKDRWEGFAFQLCVNRILVSGKTFYTVTRYDITELVQLRQMREDFSHSVIQHQAEERRRMAREVHDSTMQLLAAMGLSLGQLKRGRHSKASGEIVGEMEQMLDEAQRELRAISYLAHAPEVRELGLTMALRQLAGGFGRRTGINIALHADKTRNLSPAAETAVYRLVQEALSNIHRHAKASDAAVGLYQRRAVLHVAIADNGIGMPERLRRGVGLSSMRERIEELGGRLMIRAGHPGAVLIASLPAHAETRLVGDLAIAV